MAKRVMPHGTIIMWNEANTTPDNIDGAGSCWRELGAEMGGRFPVGVGMHSPTSGDGDVGASYTHKATRDHQNKIGRNQVSLTMEQMPKHNHNIGSNSPNSGNGANGAGTGTGNMSTFTGGTVELAEGQSMPHENRPPFYVVRFFQYVCN
jgi:microcystin-dependent protein